MPAWPFERRTHGAGQGAFIEPISIVAADSGRAFGHFVDLVYRIQGGNPLWAPPLRAQQKALLSRNHPFFAHADMRMFVAWRGNEPVGRIAAINDHTHNSIHKQRTTHFGFFECVSDQAVADALFRQVEQVAAEWGHDIVRGPFNHSVNEEIGIQIDAFDTPNYILIPGNPTYYPALVEGAGYVKSMDLFCYIMTREEMSTHLLKKAPEIQARLGIRFRKFDKANLERDAEKIWQVYNEAWSRNWFWIPMSREEFMHLVGDLKQIADFDLIWLAETLNGEIAGMIVAVPNINEVLRTIRDGRLFPAGLFKLLWGTRPGAIRSVRVLIMGVLEQFRGQGIDAVLYKHCFEAGVARGYEVGEMSQVLETNTMMNRAARMIGARRYKTHRIYEKALDPM